jgi:molybdopterin/thiamine biosynthesis adenylyltransferase
MRCESVRVVADHLSVTFDPGLVPLPRVSDAQVRTVNTWGDETQALLARLRIAVAGAGSVGMAVTDALARTGIQRIGVFDFDSVEIVNLDRLRGAERLDAYLNRPKVHIARRLLSSGSTALQPDHEVHELSICEPEGFQRLLDFDVVFSCVDRPWPRHVLNTIAYADLIPVIEGGLRAFRSPNGSFRNAYWSSTVVRPGRPCLACLKQYDPADVQVERDGSLDDPRYIEALPVGSALRSRENVAALTESVTAALLEQLVSYVARPSGFGDPGPLRFNLRDRVDVKRGREACQGGCRYPSSSGCGDGRLDPAARHVAAEEARRRRRQVPMSVVMARRADEVLQYFRRRLEKAVRSWRFRSR